MPRKIVHLFLFLAIFTLAFFLRAQESLVNNYLFLIDMGRDMMAVKGIVFDHHLTLIGPYTSLGGVFQGPFWYYLLAIPTFLTKGDPWGAVALMLVISMTTAVVAYAFMKRLFGFSAAIICFFLFAVSPEAVAAATYSWNPHVMWLLLVLYIFLLYQVRLGHKKLHLLLWPTITAMFHFEAALAVFIFVATFIYMLIKYKEVSKSYAIKGILISLLFFVPQIVFEIRHDFLMTHSVIDLVSGSERGLVVAGEKRNYVDLLLNHYGVFRNNYSSSFLHLNNFSSVPFFIFLCSLFVLFKLKKLASKKEKEFVVTVLIILLLVFFLTSFYPFPLRYWFLTGFQSFYLVLVSLLLSKLLHYRTGKLILIGLTLAFLFHSITRLDELYVHPPNDGGFAKIKGIKVAVDYIYQDAKGDPFGLLVFAPPVYTPNYDYVVWWYGRNKYNYIPHKEKKGTFYLLMEPDPSKPFSYKGWMETVVKSGETIKTETLPSGLIVEKRKSE